ncbi:hypothetical protein LINPERHAP1_LOCUS4423 [Linum perenne]
MEQGAEDSTRCGVSARWRLVPVTLARRFRSRSLTTPLLWSLSRQPAEPPSYCRRRRSGLSRIGLRATASTLRLKSIDMIDNSAALI